MKLGLIARLSAGHGKASEFAFIPDLLCRHHPCITDACRRCHRCLAAAVHLPRRPWESRPSWSSRQGWLCSPAMGRARCRGRWPACGRGAASLRVLPLPPGCSLLPGFMRPAGSGSRLGPAAADHGPPPRSRGRLQQPAGLSRCVAVARSARPGTATAGPAARCRPEARAPLAAARTALVASSRYLGRPLQALSPWSMPSFSQRLCLCRRG